MIRSILKAALLAVPLALAACSSETTTPPDVPEPAPAATEAPAAYVPSPPVEAQMEDGVQVARVEAGAMGLQPREITFRGGVPARLVFTRTVEDDCSSQITLPAYGIEATDLPMNTPVAIEFTPAENREAEFVCGMGMQRGTIAVVS